MKLPLRVFPLSLVLCVSTNLWAQNPDNTASAQPQSTSAAPAKPVSKPVRKPDQVVTDDPIGLMAVRRAPRIVSAPPAEQAASATDQGAPADAGNQRAVEIASLEKHIKEKQTQIAMLMKLFVDDEKEFLKNAGGTEMDPAVQERRKYEQDELRWETAELAKLKARLEELKNQKTENGK